MIPPEGASRAGLPAHEHGHGQAAEERAGSEGGNTVAPLRGDPKTGEAIRILTLQARIAEGEPGVSPYGVAEGEPPREVGEAGRESRHRDDDGLAAVSAGQADEMLRALPGGREGGIAPRPEQALALPAECERPLRHVELDPPIRPGLEELRTQLLEAVGTISDPGGQRIQQGLAPGEVDGTAVVGIHERERPELGALIEIWDPGHGDLEDGLGERVDSAIEGHQALEGHEHARERAARSQELIDEVEDAPIIGRVWIDPARAAFRLLC